jgi:hypothetical protein
MVMLTLNVQPTKAIDQSITGIGEWISDGRVEICVHAFSSSPTLSFYPYEPDNTGFVFAWVDVSLKNVGTEDVSTNKLYTHLKDTSNYMYGNVYTSSPKEWDLVDLPPGETLRGEIYFEVPAEAVVDRFVWSSYTSYIYMFQSFHHSSFYRYSSQQHYW